MSRHLLRHSRAGGNPGAEPADYARHPRARLHGDDGFLLRIRERLKAATFTAALVTFAATLVTTAASAQQLRTYTQSETGPQFLTYGLPVPIPIDSLTPVDGFRTHAGVQARLQDLALHSADLAAHDVGRTLADRTIWAYVASDEDASDVEGRPEAAFFINASTHAREWAAPEVSTGTLEHLMAGAGDGGIVRYLLDNTRVVVIPVHNIDGVLQTHRFPTDVLVGQDPDFPADWPRDGRMRRKNMRGVDEVLSTTGDHLLGIDLNRNHPPFWATSTSSSGNQNSLVFHGAGPHSEPENQALLAAARLAPESRIRLGIDVHTFGKVYFSSNTARTRLNTIQRTLITRMINHHEAVANTRYTDVLDPPNRGIGAAAEYFAYQWLVPAWTLELEPGESAAEYGGTAVTHGGFILPANQARRVREGWAQTHLIAFYQMSGPPHLARVRYLDAQTGAVALQMRWRYDATSGLRERVADVPGTLVPGRRYRAELAFSKPMRWRDAQGNIASLPGLPQAPAAVSATLVQGAARTALDTSGGSWITDPSRVLRYRDDTFAFEFDAPAATGDFTLEVATSDFTSMSLDADPASPVDWSQGAWSEYENSQGLDGDFGGADRSFALSVAASPLLVVRPAPALAGEGDAFDIDVQLPAPAAQVLGLALARGTQFEALTNWTAGTSDRRTVRIHLEDDVLAQGDRDVSLALHLLGSNGTSLGVAATLTLRVLDNDSEALAVIRGLRVPNGSFEGAPSGAARAVVLDRRDYHGPTVPEFVCTTLDYFGPLRVYGNGATLRPGGSGCGVSVRYDGTGGEMEFQDVTFAAVGEPFVAEPPLLLAETLLTGHGDLRLQRTRFDARFDQGNGIGSADSAMLDARDGRIRIAQGRFENRRASAARAGLRFRNATVEMDGSYVREVDGQALIEVEGGSIALRSTTLDAPGAATRALVLSAGASASWRGSLVQGSDVSPALCEGSTDSVSQGFNLFADASCAAVAASDGVMRVPLSFDAADERYDVPAVARDTGGAECGLDTRGAPRPQSAACDAGAFEHGINPYRGIWSPARSGHGVDIQTVGNRLFLAWYTYEDDGEPTAYQAVAPFTGLHWEARLQQSSRNPQTGALMVSDVGRVTIDFADDTHATLGWRFDARGIDGSEAITAALFAPDDPRFEVTGLWYPPADSGHGATISRRGAVTAIGVYYYDAQGNVRWALGTGSDADAQEFAMTSFRGFCPDCSAAQNPVTGTPAGTALVHFHTPVQARVDLQLTYPGAAGGTWNRAGARFVPLNDPVDNTDALR